MRQLDVLKAEADDAIIHAEMARTYADGAHGRLTSRRAGFDRSIRAAEARLATVTLAADQRRPPPDEGVSASGSSFD